MLTRPRIVLAISSATALTLGLIAAGCGGSSESEAPKPDESSAPQRTVDANAEPACTSSQHLPPNRDCYNGAVVSAGDRCELSASEARAAEEDFRFAAPLRVYVAYSGERLQCELRRGEAPRAATWRRIEYVKQQPPPKFTPTPASRATEKCRTIGQTVTVAGQTYICENAG